MNKVILATHGNLAMGMSDTLQMLAGDISDLLIVNIDEQGQSVFEEKIETILNDINSDPILVLTDINGGSPFQTFMKFKLINDLNMEIVAGVNLPMILDVYLSRGTVSLEELKCKAIDTGKSGVVSVDIKKNEKSLDE